VDWICNAKEDKERCGDKDSGAPQEALPNTHAVTSHDHRPKQSVDGLSRLLDVGTIANGTLEGEALLGTNV